MSNNGNIVVEWLRSLHLGQYAESFLDNGYDDLEICKQVGDPDLDAIGVFNPNHRNRLLQSVRTLREEGAASVYFTLEESAAIQEECQCDSASARSSRTSSGRVSEKDGLGRSPAGSSSAGSAQELGRYLDEYEEGKAELVRIPRIQLKVLLKEKLAQDGIRLSCQPYSTSEGERGYLEGLASRYADLYNTHYGDVLEHLEELRRREWAELSPRIRVLGPLTPTTPPGPAPSTPPPLTHHRLAPAATLTSSQSQPIYVPGKYSPSSCLSDKEEDEIYGFAGYGVYGKHMLQRQQQQAKLVIAPRHNYQNCLSPRSAYFYEFPPNERPGKKKTSFSRFLRHLKTHRKDKSISPRHPSSRLKVQEALKKKEKFDREHEEILRDIRQGLLQLSRGVSDDTYMYDDEMQRLGQHWYDEPPYESDPEDFLMADTSNHSRVCFTLNVRNESRSGESGVISLRSAGDISLPHHQRRSAAILASGPPPHPLMHVPARNNRESGDYATSDVQSVCSQMSSLSMETSRSEQLEPDMYHRIRAFNGVESAISPGHSSDYAGQEELVTLHSSCGNTSLAHRVRGLKGDNSVSTMKKPQSSGHRNAALHHSSAESLPSGSSLQALVPPSSNHSSEDSTTPMDDSVRVPMLARARALVDYTPSPYDEDALKFKGVESAISPGHSSDYAGQEELVTLHSSCGNTSLAHRVRGLKGDNSVSTMKKPQSSGHRNAALHHSSAESLPSGSSLQALVPPSSNHSSEDSTTPMDDSVRVPMLARARALVDYTPSPYDEDALKFKKGDIIEVLSMSKSGLWRGRTKGGREGRWREGQFKFINVELMPETHVRPHKPRHRPHTIEQMLRTIQMEEHMSLFVLNGYEDLEAFSEIREKDLDYLGMTDPQHRAKILAAVQVLNEYESADEGRSSTDDEAALRLRENAAANNLAWTRRLQADAAPPFSCMQPQPAHQPTHSCPTYLRPPLTTEPTRTPLK
ncbi:uncharacterized protein LOC111055637 [Nilaparvata lugens]|uniref:uncharacterized protein LOC111055637 n=1 Tax=Nilaparvata lugens TaxID=108931 RepID=UPI00193D748C|nr:uncharacterized protein LOC111055637 [Nilaparvata lugens]